MATASLILGIASYVTCGLTMIPAVICGIIALSRIKTAGGLLGGRGQAIAGIIVGATTLIVIAVVGLLAALAMPAFAKTRNRAQVAAAHNDIDVISLALSMYEQDNGFLPTTERGLSALVAPTTTGSVSARWSGPYIERLPVDPWGHPYIYQYPGRRDPATFELSSLGPDGLEGGGDDISSAD